MRQLAAGAGTHLPPIAYICSVLTLRKSISSFFVLLAYAIIFCHGVVPHHHHHPAISLQHTGDEGESHDGSDADQGALAKAFALFHHDGEGTQITYQPAQAGVQVPDIGLYVEAILPLLYEIRCAERPRAVYGEPDAVAIQHSFFSASFLRRGPPTVMMG